MLVNVKVEIPAGYELASDTIRPAEFGEYILENGHAKKWADTEKSCRYHVIIRKAWQWPAWLKAAALVMDKKGRWMACKTVPTLTPDDSWDPYVWWVPVAHEFIDFTPPPCDDWRDSLRINPRLRGDQ